MPPFCNNKALPTPTLTLPHTLFSTVWLFPSFLLKINAFLMWFEIWKGRKKNCQKADSYLSWSHQNEFEHTFYHLRHWIWRQLTVFCNFDQPNHTLVGGVSVNSLCHQGGLFALSVNRHSVFFYCPALYQPSATLLSKISALLIEKSISVFH